MGIEPNSTYFDGRIPRGLMHSPGMRSARDVRGDLFQVFDLRRSRQGQIYFEWPGREPEEWDPHTSYLSSGELHQKSFGSTYGIIQRQRPDASFSGTGQCMQTPLVSGEA